MLIKDQLRITISLKNDWRSYTDYINSCIKVIEKWLKIEKITLNICIYNIGYA